jgi:transcriptional regulator with XRE-family HTH domain
MALTTTAPHQHADAPRFTLGDRMRKALDVADVSNQRMAAELGVSRNTVSNYMRGRAVPRLAMLRVWAEVTDVPLEWLLGDDSRCELCGEPRSRCFCGVSFGAAA